MTTSVDYIVVILKYGNFQGLRLIFHCKIWVVERTVKLHRLEYSGLEYSGSTLIFVGKEEISTRMAQEIINSVGCELLNLQIEEPTIGVETTIFRVPKLLRECNQQFYTPSFVSIGLCHVGKSELLNVAMNKRVAYIRMNERLNGNGSLSRYEFAYLISQMEQNQCFKMIWAYEEYIIDEFRREHDEFGREWREFKMEEDEIRRELGFDGVLVGFVECFSYVVYEVMAIRLFMKDACFIFEFLLNYLRCIKGKENYLEEWVVQRGNNPIFNSWIQNPTWQGIVYDLLLLENQIPLYFLTLLGRMGLPSLGSSVGAEESIIKMIWEFASLNHNGIFTWLSPCSSPPKESSHLLDLFYKRIVASNLQSYQDGGYPWDESQSFIPMPFKYLLHYCKGIFIYKDVFTHFFIQCWSSVRGYFPCSEPMGEEGCEPPTLQIPSAAELRRAGVKFQAVRWKSGMKATPIRYIRFDERKSTLYLPEFRVDMNAQSLLRNFIALELTSTNYCPRPITNFALFMDELINSEEDVGVLRKAGILRNFVWSDVQLANNFNGLGRGIPLHEGCKVVDEARLGLRKYLKRRYKILWNEFKSTYFSKPWLFLGSIGAVLLLLMTMVQVFCLFYTCNRSEKNHFA